MDSHRKPELHNSFSSSFASLRFTSNIKNRRTIVRMRRVSPRVRWNGNATTNYALVVPYIMHQLCGVRTATATHHYLLYSEFAARSLEIFISYISHNTRATNETDDKCVERHTLLLLLLLLLRASKNVLSFFVTRARNRLDRN